MKLKKSQITFMILLALSILAIAGLIIFAANYFKSKTSIEHLVFEKASIEGYINNCVKKTAENGLVLLGEQGGYILLEEYLEAPNYGISFLYSKGNKIPSIEKMQSQLSFYIDNNLNICLKDFEDFKKQGWEVEKGNLNSRTQINERDVSFDIDFFVKVINKDSIINFERFSITLDVRLRYIYDLVVKIVEFNANNPISVDRTELSRHDLNVTVFLYKNSMVYSIQDSKSLIMNKPYQLNFAMKFDDKP